MGYGQNFHALPDHVKAKYAEAREADKGKDPVETEDHVKTLEVFDATDANKDGKIDGDEFPAFQKGVMAWRDERYGGHAEIEGDSLVAFKKLAFTVSEPHDSFTKSDLDFVARLMVKIRSEY